MYTLIFILFYFSDYNECTNRIQGFCDAFATCVNLVGSYRCICPANYNQVGNHCVKKITRTTGKPC